MLELIIKSFWFLLPAAFANMAPVLFKWIPVGDVPVDLGKDFEGTRILGDHKTFRGLVVGILNAILVLKIQVILYPQMSGYSILNYSSIDVVNWGIILGGGALVGDLMKSFFKRRRGITPGEDFAIFDQIDWIIGALLATGLFIPLGADIIISSLILFGLLHVLVKWIGNKLGFE